MDNCDTCCVLNVSKHFGSVKALDSISLDIKAGELLAVVGENGAGKSTLMNILFGLLTPDSGAVKTSGRLGMVHQHFMLYPRMSVLENVLIGAEGKTKFGFIRFGSRRREVQAVLDEFGFSLNLDQRVEGLSMDARQQLEIVKMLYRGAETIILDEPTAVLIPREVERLFEVVDKLKRQGKAIVLVTHKLVEVMDHADRVVVMRGGRHVAELAVAHTSQSALAALMVGQAIQPVIKTECPPGQVLLDVQHLCVAGPGKLPMLDDISFSVRAGEIVGVAGVSGSGQKALIDILVGLGDASMGSVIFQGRDLLALSIEARRHQGLAYIAEDRMSVGLATQATVAENAIAGRETTADMSTRRWFSRPAGGFLRHASIRDFTRFLIDRFDIRTTGPSQTVADLSGGNKQKIIVARELSTNPTLVIAENPCWGVDIGAISFIQRQLLDCARSGSAIVLVSTELEELFKISDRVIVLYNGCISAEFYRHELDVYAVGEAMSGSVAA